MVGEKVKMAHRLQVCNSCGYCQCALFSLSLSVADSERCRCS